MKEDKQICVSELKKQVDAIAEEVFCNGTSIASHEVRSTTTAYCEELDQWFDIVDIEPDRMMGCGCWSGLVINLKKGDA